MATEFKPDRVYLRDASCAVYPGRGGKYHFADASGLSACGRAILLEDTDEDPEDVKYYQMCRAPGCWKRYLFLETGDD